MTHASSLNARSGTKCCDLHSRSATHALIQCKDETCKLYNDCIITLPVMNTPMNTPNGPTCAGHVPVEHYIAYVPLVSMQNNRRMC